MRKWDGKKSQEEEHTLQSRTITYYYVCFPDFTREINKKKRKDALKKDARFMDHTALFRGDKALSGKQSFLSTFDAKLFQYSRNGERIFLLNNGTIRGPIFFCSSEKQLKIILRRKLSHCDLIADGPIRKYFEHNYSEGWMLIICFSHLQGYHSFYSYLWGDLINSPAIWNGDGKTRVSIAHCFCSARLVSISDDFQTLFLLFCSDCSLVFGYGLQTRREGARRRRKGLHLLLLLPWL